MEGGEVVGADGAIAAAAVDARVTSALTSAFVAVVVDGTANVTVTFYNISVCFENNKSITYCWVIDNTQNDQTQTIFKFFFNIVGRKNSFLGS